MRAALEQSSRRAIPAVESVLQAIGATELPRPLVVQLIRRELERVRRTEVIPEATVILAEVRSAVLKHESKRIQPVINGTGILIHTNFGRAPLSDAAVEAMCAVARGYSNLEYDLSTGERGVRAPLLEEMLALACGAEATTVVNNCAAALVLALRHFTRKRRNVIISRGELVQIGGGFRIPDVLEASGAALVEVGTTNQTTVEDYARALNEETGLVLKVHRSNFQMSGFVASPRTEDLAVLAREQSIPLVEDLGTGALTDLEEFGFESGEISPRAVLEKGVDLVTFSGDKLVGGPQAGIIAGKLELVRALKREPFFRALRCDKLVLSALEATVSAYLRGDGGNQIPVLRMARIPLRELQKRAEMVQAKVSDLPIRVSIAASKCEFGGGTLPQKEIDSVALELNESECDLEEIAAKLRDYRVIGYISEGRFRIDLRTVFPRQDDDLVQAIRSVFHGPKELHSRNSGPR
jgi:L-seryl-tRNA(Ser) seleniumtransferase